MGKNSKQSSTTESAPWAPAQGHLKDQMAGAAAWRDSPIASSTYQGDRTANMSSQTQAGVDTLTNGTGTNASMDFMRRVLGGEFLNSENPHQAALDSSIKAAVMPVVNSTFSNSGMTGSTTHQGVLTRALTDGLAAPRYQNYQAERGYQNNAALALPGMEDQRARQQLLAGLTREGYEQRDIDAAMAKFEEERTAGLRPYLETQPIFGQVGSMGGTSTTTQTKKPSMFEQLMGGGMMAASMLSAPMTGGASLAALPTFATGASGNTWGVNAPHGSLPWQTAA